MTEYSAPFVRIRGFSTAHYSIDRTTAFNSSNIEFDEAKKDALIYKKYLEVLNKTVNK